MDRRSFIRSVGLTASIVFLPVKLFSNVAYQKGILAAENVSNKVLDIIYSLKKEGSSIVNKVLNGKKYVFDPYTHYPYDGGVIDERTNCRAFFHAHREEEYGHFHTFCEDENGDLVHLIMISMNEKGEPQMLATVNNWVTGDKYVKADKLKEYLNNFYIDPNSYKKEKRLIQFVNNIFSSYKETCHNLFEERDKWIRNYAFTNYRKPFEDREFEVLSFKKIDVFKDLN